MQIEAEAVISELRTIISEQAFQLAVARAQLAALTPQQEAGQ